jgi:hypothetical protein
MKKIGVRIKVKMNALISPLELNIGNCKLRYKEMLRGMQPLKQKPSKGFQ